MLLYCSASLRFFLSLLCVLSVCYLYCTRRNVKSLKSQTFINPLLISITNDKQKYFKNL